MASGDWTRVQCLQEQVLCWLSHLPSLLKLLRGLLWNEKRKRHCLYPYFLKCQILAVSPCSLIGLLPWHQGHRPVFGELLFHFVGWWPFSWLSTPWFFCYDSQPHLDPKSHPLEISPISKKHSLPLPNGSHFSYFALPFIGHTTVMHFLWIFVHIQCSDRGAGLMLQFRMHLSCWSKNSLWEGTLLYLSEWCWVWEAFECLAGRLIAQPRTQ